MDLAGFNRLIDQLHRLAVTHTRSGVGNSDRQRMERLIVQNQMTEEPKWMVRLLQMVNTGRSLSEVVKVPSGDPHGDIGLSNLLLDFRDQIAPLDIDEYGEGMRWKIPATGVVVEIMRETRDNEPLMVIRPMDSDYIDWTVAHVRALGESKARSFV